jgi:hypothetical protein
VKLELIGNQFRNFFSPVDDGDGIVSIRHRSASYKWKPADKTAGFCFTAIRRLLARFTFL